MGCFRFQVPCFTLNRKGREGFAMVRKFYIFLAPSVAFLAVHFMFQIPRFMFHVPCFRGRFLGWVVFNEGASGTIE